MLISSYGKKVIKGVALGLLLSHSSVMSGELVGSGSFGQVFGGILTKTGKRIAVKEVFLSGAKGQLDQAKAMQGISHDGNVFSKI